LIGCCPAALSSFFAAATAHPRQKAIAVALLPTLGQCYAHLYNNFMIHTSTPFFFNIF